MNEKYYTNLEISKKLKELGVPQENREAYWCPPEMFIGCEIRSRKDGVSDESKRETRRIKSM